MKSSRRLTALFASTVIGLSLIAPVLVQAATPTVTSNISTGLTAAAQGYGDTSTSLPDVIGRLVNVALTLLGTLLLAYLIYGGYLWMTAAGDDAKVKKARGLIRDAIIGLVIVVAANAIATYVVDRLAFVVSGSPG